MKKATIFIAALASILTFSTCIAAPKSTDDIIHDSLVEVTTEMNKTLPTMVDEETRLDRVGVYRKTFYGRYTMVNFAIEELDRTQIQGMHDGLKTLHVNSYCTNPGSKMLRDNNSGRELDIYDKNAKWVTTITVAPGDCK
jgi:hypothetical protein